MEERGGGGGGGGGITPVCARSLQYVPESWLELHMWTLYTNKEVQLLCMLPCTQKSLSRFWPMVVAVTRDSMGVTFPVAQVITVSPPNLTGKRKKSTVPCHSTLLRQFHLCNQDCCNQCFTACCGLQYSQQRLQPHRSGAFLPVMSGAFL